MKSKILKLLFIFLFSGLYFSCDFIFKPDPPSGPGISIYKTKGDYFNLVDIGMKGDKIFRTESFWNSRYNSMDKLEIIGNDTIYKGRYKLPNGYILDAEADERYDVFLDITFKEQLYRELAGNHPTVAMPFDTIRKYIIDKDPYTEFYRNKTKIRVLSIADSLEIKRIILLGEIDKYFEKLK
jgi:hypothetical protein